MKKRFKKIYIEITNSCNLNCDFCIKNKRENKFITKEEFESILNKIEDYTDYLYFHVLGEPLLHPYINELIDIASKKFKVNITTNGYLIDRIKNNDNIRQLNISLHSYDEKYNIKLDDYLNNLFNTLDELIKKGTIVSLRLWVENRNNKKIINYINKRYNTNITNNTIKNDLYINNFHEFIWPDLNNNTYDSAGTCYGLIDHIGILSDGTIIPCCLDSNKTINLGNIYNDNLDNVLKQERVINMINGFKNNTKCEELCKHCKFIEK